MHFVVEILVPILHVMKCIPVDSLFSLRKNALSKTFNCAPAIFKLQRRILR